ncbi:MAG TPA: pitrilysin family protein [Thermoanaerobaculia bacterium]|nr:pitrilysin family protein [Thermoanaerobaculia bacterium]
MSPKFQKSFLCGIGTALVVASLPVAAATSLNKATMTKTSTPASTSAIKLSAFREVVLPNGARLLLMEKRDVPLIAFTALVRGGAIADPANREGLASITAELLQKGAGGRNTAQLAEAIDRVGGSISTSSAREAISITGEFMNRDAALMIELLGDMLRRPTFPADEVEKVRDRSVETIAAAKDSDLRSLMGTYFNAFLFGSNLYGRPTGGSETSLATIRRDDVLSYYKAHFGGDRLILAVVGDFEASSLEAKLRSAFGDWAKTASPAPAATSFQTVTGRRVLLVDKPDATQTYFWIGNLGVNRADRERASIDLANTVFGGRFTSLLNTELRVKSGLSYGASSVLSRGLQPGAAAIASYTKTESTGKAVDLAIDVLKQYRTDGMNDETLNSAKSYVLGQFPTSIETGDQIANRLADIALYGLEKNDVELYGEGVGKTTIADVKKVINRVYADPANLSFLFIGNADAIREMVKKYGPVTEMKITDKSFSPKM